MHSQLFVSSLIALATLIGAPAQAQDIKIAVLPTQLDASAKGKVPNLLDDYYLTAVQNLGGFEVIGKDDIEALIGFEDQKDLLGCDDASCMANIGGALGVDKIVVIKIALLGTDWIATGKLINIKLTKVEKRVSRFVAGDVKALFQDAVPLIEELFGRRVSSVPGPAPAPRATPTPPPSGGGFQPPPAAALGATARPGFKASTGWSLAGAIMGFSSAGLTLILGSISGAATCYTCSSTFPTIMGATATVLFAVMTPITYVAGKTPRKHPDVNGVTAMRVIGWITYGIMAAYDVTLLMLSILEVEVTSFMVYTATVGSAAATGFMALDTLVAYIQAKRVSSRQAASADAYTDDFTILPTMRFARERDNSGSYPVMGLAMTF